MIAIIPKVTFNSSSTVANCIYLKKKQHIIHIKIFFGTTFFSKKHFLNPNQLIIRIYFLI